MRSLPGWKCPGMSSRMHRLVTVAAATALAGAACVKGAPKGSNEASGATTVAEQICSDCHEVGKLDRVEALLMVSSERMPPPQVGIDDTMRGKLVRHFCAAEYGPGDRQCLQEYLRPTVERTAIPMPVLRSQLGLATGGEQKTDPNTERQAQLSHDIEAYLRRADPRVHYEPTLEAFRVLASYLRCQAATNRDACIEAILGSSIELDARGMVKP
jgi:hypothetical protein